MDDDVITSWPSLLLASASAVVVIITTAFVAVVAANTKQTVKNMNPKQWFQSIFELWSQTWSGGWQRGRRWSWRC